MTWIAIKLQFHALDSNVAVFYRFFLASLILFSIALIKKTNLRFNKFDHLRFLGQGFFMFCLNFLMTYWASHKAPSALIALAFTAIIYFNMFFGRIFLGIPFEKKVIYGAIVSFLGMALISSNELVQLNNHPGYLLGFLISLAATVSASIGNIISAKSRQMKVPIISNNAWGMLYGSCLSLIFCLITEKSFAVNFDLKFVLAFSYLTLFGTIISFGAYLKLIELVGPAKAGFTSVISPVIAITISMYFENLEFSWIMSLGVLFCLIGNLIVLFNKSWLLLRLRPAT